MPWDLHLLIRGRQNLDFNLYVQEAGRVCGDSETQGTSTLHLVWWSARAGIRSSCCVLAFEAAHVFADVVAVVSNRATKA